MNICSIKSPVIQLFDYRLMLTHIKATSKSAHTGPVTRKKLQFDDVIMKQAS